MITKEAGVKDCPLALPEMTITDVQRVRAGRVDLGGTPRRVFAPHLGPRGCRLSRKMAHPATHMWSPARLRKAKAVILGKTDVSEWSPLDSISGSAVAAPANTQLPQVAALLHLATCCRTGDFA